MELKLFEEYKKKEEYYLRLMHSGASIVELAVVDEDGNRCSCGTLLTITQKGIIILHSHISPKFGFDLDEQGRLKVNSEI